MRACSVISCTNISSIFPKLDSYLAIALNVKYLQNEIHLSPATLSGIVKLFLLCIMPSVFKVYECLNKRALARLGIPDDDYLIYVHFFFIKS
jgi:hypothetical protein